MAIVLLLLLHVPWPVSYRHTEMVTMPQQSAVNNSQLLYAEDQEYMPVFIVIVQCCAASLSPPCNFNNDNLILNVSTHCQIWACAVVHKAIIY